MVRCGGGRDGGSVAVGHRGSTKMKESALTTAKWRFGGEAAKGLMARCYTMVLGAGPGCTTQHFCAYSNVKN